jgi:hypothetical protein
VGIEWDEVLPWALFIISLALNVVLGLALISRRR